MLNNSVTLNRLNSDFNSLYYGLIEPGWGWDIVDVPSLINYKSTISISGRVTISLPRDYLIYLEISKIFKKLIES